MNEKSLIDEVITYEEVAKRGNYFSKIDGGYPTGMSVCYIVGISGDCGFSCPDFQAGVCEFGVEMLEKITKEDAEDEEEYNFLKGLYCEE